MKTEKSGLQTHKEQMVARVVDGIINNKSDYQQIALSDQTIGIQLTRRIAEALESTSVVKELDLSGNEFGDAGAVAIAEALRVNKSITNINLSFNQIGERGIRALADSLETNTTVIEANLKDNVIANTGNSLDRIERLIKRNRAALIAKSPPSKNTPKSSVMTPPIQSYDLSEEERKFLRVSEYGVSGIKMPDNPRNGITVLRGPFLQNNEVAIVFKGSKKTIDGVEADIYEGDDIQYIGINGVNNSFSIRVRIACGEGLHKFYFEGKEKVKETNRGEIIFDEKTVFSKDPDGKYHPLSITRISNDDEKKYKEMKIKAMSVIGSERYLGTFSRGEIFSQFVESEPEHRRRRIESQKKLNAQLSSTGAAFKAQKSTARVAPISQTEISANNPELNEDSLKKELFVRAIFDECAQKIRNWTTSGSEEDQVRNTNKIMQFLDEAEIPKSLDPGLHISRSFRKENVVSVAFNGTKKIKNGIERDVYEGDDIAYVHVKGCDNIFIRAQVSIQEGIHQNFYINGEQTVKPFRYGEIVFDEKTVFLKDKDGNYLPKNIQSVSDAERELYENFKIKALSVIGEKRNAAVLYNGVAVSPTFELAMTSEPSRSFVPTRVEKIVEPEKGCCTIM